MSVGAFYSLIHRGLFADDAVAALFDDREQIRAMLDVEAALARAEAAAGLIPGEAADGISNAARTLELDPARFTEATATSGVPVGPLISALRDAAGVESAPWVHWGATSQDIVDTALVLRLRGAIDILDERLAAVSGRLLELARRYADTPLTGRTRSQAAVPSSFGLQAAGWAAPLQRHRRRLEELKPRLLVVQLGGAAGTRSVFGPSAKAVVAALARELELGTTALPWHSQRDAVAELAGWLSLVTASLAKLGRDVILLAQTEVGELRIEGGGSSTMPQKTNPVAAEILVALARHNASLLGEMHQAMVHAQERDGAAWSSEWLALPQMTVAAGAALARTDTLLDSLTVDADRMADNLAALDGLVLAESATFALARYVPLPEAQRLVAAAARETREKGGHLLDRLAAETDAPVDWEALKDPARQIETARNMVHDFLSHRD